MELIDTHCHLHFSNFPDRGTVIADAKAAGVGRLISVGTSLADSQKAVTLAAQYDNVWASAGVHPHDSADYLKDKTAGQNLGRLLTKPRVVAIGELGLDYFHEHTPRADQQKALKKQIEIGLEAGLPFIFHVRDAWEDFWRIYDEYRISKGVVHSFSAHPRQLEEILRRGLYVGLNGIMTFTRDQAQLEAAKKVPAASLLLETDAPFLAPKPFRGKTCEPKHALTIAEFLADLRGETLEELAEATTRNAVKLFGLEP